MSTKWNTNKQNEMQFKAIPVKKSQAKTILYSVNFLIYFFPEKVFVSIFTIFELNSQQMRLACCVLCGTVHIMQIFFLVFYAILVLSISFNFHVIFSTSAPFKVFTPFSCVVIVICSFAMSYKCYKLGACECYRMLSPLHQRASLLHKQNSFQRLQCLSA